MLNLITNITAVSKPYIIRMTNTPTLDINYYVVMPKPMQPILSSKAVDQGNHSQLLVYIFL